MEAQQLATVVVKPGETTVTNLGGTGRTIAGKMTFADGAAPDFKNGIVTVTTPVFKFIQNMGQLKTDEERTAFYQSAEFQAATKGAPIFPRRCCRMVHFAWRTCRREGMRLAFNRSRRPEISPRSPCS